MARDRRMLAGETPEAQYLADRVAVIAAGRIVAEGTRPSLEDVYLRLTEPGG